MITNLNPVTIRYWTDTDTDVHPAGCSSSGLHANCKVLVGVKKLSGNSEARMLQWLQSGLSVPGGKNGGAEHKATLLVLYLLLYFLY